jgi:uncharacterized pyridoxal phosphate-containing UPF0001 family protein
MTDCLQERPSLMNTAVGARADGAPNSLAERIEALRARIAESARRAGRDPAVITLVGVTKRQPRESVVEALAAGLTDVAENYAQEASEKYAALPPARKHFIGHIQTNKAKSIVATFDVVQSIDRLDAGKAIAKAARAANKRVETLVQVNVSPTDRFGVAPADAAALATRLREDEGLVVGAEIARAFAKAAQTFAAVGGSTLSLGMSGDWEEAIGCGSTMLRIGTAIFGERE